MSEIKIVYPDGYDELAAFESEKKATWKVLKFTSKANTLR